MPEPKTISGATMKTNDLKKGDRIQLRNNWFATIADSRKGNIRLATVEGIYTETGSIYAHDIILYFPPDGAPISVLHTPAQRKLRDHILSLANMTRRS